MQGLKFQVRVGPGSRIELEVPGAEEGELVEVIVLLKEKSEPVVQAEERRDAAWANR